MKFDKNDQTVIEQALKAAAANTSDYQEVYQYQSVLEKISKFNTPKGPMNLDGFRYDYDDDSDLM